MGNNFPRESTLRMTKPYIKNILAPSLRVAPKRHEAISQEISYENEIRDCFVWISMLRISTLLAMTEKFLRQVLDNLKVKKEH
jgi:hypothetical protein